jgi:hypothetical protein
MLVTKFVRIMDVTRLTTSLRILAETSPPFVSNRGRPLHGWVRLGRTRIGWTAGHAMS